MGCGAKNISFVLRIIGTYCKCVISPSPTLTGDEYMNARRQIASIIAIATVAWPAVSPAEAPGQAECLKALMASLAATYQPAPRLRDASFVNYGSPFGMGNSNFEVVLKGIS